MKDIIFGMAVGGIIGILLYKNNKCTQEAFDKGEALLIKEIEKLENSQNQNKKNNNKAK